jgi:hypothetical protein
MLNKLQQLILNVIEENTVGDSGVLVTGGAGNTDFSAFNAPNPNAAYSPASFDKSDIRGDYAASKASDGMTKKHKRSRKKQIASKILRRLPIMEPKRTF